MQVLIDYLTISSKIHNVNFFIDSVGLTDVNFLETSGRYGWKEGLYYRGVNIYYGGSRDDVCMELSGCGCRTVEELSDNTFNWFEFLFSLEPDILDRNVNISRLDIAGDDKDGILDYRKMIVHCRKKKYICKARYNMWTDGDEQNIYFGSPKSDRRLRIYNKALEQGTEEHWIRCEMQMRNDNAVSFILNWFKSKDIGLCYSSVLIDFLRFVKNNVDNNNYTRALVCSWWTEFVGAVKGCKQLYIDGGTYCMAQVFDYLSTQVGSSLKLLLEVNNGDISDLLAIINGAHLNYRQTMLLDKIRIEQAKDVVLNLDRNIY